MADGAIDEEEALKMREMNDFVELVDEQECCHMYRALLRQRPQLMQLGGIRM